MASNGFKAARAFNARKRIEDSLSSISSKFGVERTETTGVVSNRDPELKNIIHLESVADFLENVEAHLTALAQPAAPAKKGKAKTQVTTEDES
jgi:hypothetical protein